MEIIYPKRFLRRLDNQPVKIQGKFRNRVILFKKDKYNPLLNNHVLAGEHRARRSINISGDVRAIFEESEDGETVVFISVGTHSQLYG